MKGAQAMLTAYLVLVITGFSTFMIVLASVYAFVKQGDRQAARAQASAGKVAPVVAAPGLAEAVDVGGEVRDLVGVH
jgi:hypothetical protein